MSTPSFQEQQVELAMAKKPLAFRAVEQLQQLKRLIPARRLPALVEKRIDKLWEDPAFRSSQEAQLESLLSHTERADEVPELARAYAEWMMLRSYRRFHPRAITHQTVSGAEWLTTRRDPARSYVLCFLHHGQFDGMFASLGAHGIPLHVLVSRLIVSPHAAIGFRQHGKVVGRHRRTELVLAEGGTDAIVEQLTPGRILAIAPDIPGRTKVMFLGKERLASFGVARIATVTDSPVVLVTSHRDGDSCSLQLHEPLEPSDFASPGDLLAEIMRRHEPAVLAFPEGLETPAARFGDPETAD